MAPGASAKRAKTEPARSPVDAYIAAQPKALQAALKCVRAAIKCAMPGAEETLSYKMPACRLHGRIVLFFASWKEHYSHYPAGARTAEAFAKELKPYEVVKGTI